MLFIAVDASNHGLCMVHCFIHWISAILITFSLQEYSQSCTPRRPSPLLGHSPHPHTLTHHRNISSSQTDEPPTTLSDISLQLPLYEDPTTLSELIHVRTNVTKAELHNIQLKDRKTFKNLQQEKVLFSYHVQSYSMKENINCMLKY